MCEGAIGEGRNFDNMVIDYLEKTSSGVVEVNSDEDKGVDQGEPDLTERESTSEIEDVIVVHGIKDVNIRERPEGDDSLEHLSLEEEILKDDHEDNTMGTEKERNEGVEDDTMGTVKERDKVDEEEH